MGLAHNSPPIIESTSALHFRWRWQNGCWNSVSCASGGGEVAVDILLLLDGTTTTVVNLGSITFRGGGALFFLLAPSPSPDAGFPHNDDS